MTPIVQRRFAMAATIGPVLSILLASLGTSIANVALPEMAAGLSAPFATVQWVVIGYLLSLTVLSAAAGRLGDRIGHGRALRLGMVAFTVGAAAAAVAPQVGWLIAARMVQGAGAAAMIVLPMALLRETADPARLGRAMGFLGTASAVGTALGPALGGVLIAGFGWRAVFWVMLALGGLGLATVQSTGAKPKAQAAMDLRPAVLLAVAVAGVALAATLRDGWISIALLGLSVAAALLFRKVDERSAQPFFPAGAMGAEVLRRGLIANALVAAVMMTMLVVSPFFLARGLGLQAGAVGMAMTLGPVLSAASGIPSGRLVDRWGAAPVARLGVVLMLLAVAVIAAGTQVAGLWGFLAGVVFLTPGYQLYLAANTTQVLMTAGEAQRGATSGLLGLSRNLGLIAGAAVMAALFGWATGSGDAAQADPAVVVWATGGTFAAAAALLIAAVALLRPDVRK